MHACMGGESENINLTVAALESNLIECRWMKEKKLANLIMTTQNPYNNERNEE